MVGLLGIFNIGSWDGRDFYGVDLGEIFLHFFQYLGFVRLDFETFIIVHGCRVLKYYIFLYLNARLINPASRDFFIHYFPSDFFTEK